MNLDDDLRALRNQIDALVDPVKRGGDPGPAREARAEVYTTVLRAVMAGHPQSMVMVAEALQARSPHPAGMSLGGRP